MSPPRTAPSPDLRGGDLLELAADTRALVVRLEASLRDNPERLSVSAFNEAFARLLRNQVAILETLAGLTGVRRDGPVSAPVPADAASASSDELDAAGDVLENVDELEDDEEDDEDGADTQGGASGPPIPAAADPSKPMKSPVVSRRIEGADARPFVEAFDNRDKSFNRGLDKLNNWLGGGTPFQYRGARAYLNVSNLDHEGIVRFEEMLMGRMGFDTRLGVLIVEGLAGEVRLYEKSDYRGGET